MGVKEGILSGLKPALVDEIRKGLQTGRLKQPIDMRETMDNIWKRLRMNVQTSGAILIFGIKKEDLEPVVCDAFKDLGVQIK